MAYKALYRIYRPQTFEEVVGQKYIIQTLKHAIEDNKIAHAYLFTGPRGTGKTTIAKILAKGVNCTSNEGKPCGKCPSCLAVTNNNHPDVVEIDAASNNGVDEVRELIDKVKYSPVEGKYKVYIIDEVHMMTPGAFNALLKTLEEPPAHVIFVLATTEVHKVLPTIISRCQRFDFGRVSNKDLIQRITSVLDQEKVNYEKEAVDLIAELADGGVRDSLGIVDQALAYSGGDLTLQDIREIYGVVSVNEMIDFLNICKEGNIEKALDTINMFEQKGSDINRFTSSLIDVLKELVVYRKTRNLNLLKLLNKERVEKLLNNFSSEDAFAYIEILLEAQSNYKKVNTPKSYFELASLKMCHIEHKEDAVQTIVKEVIVTKEVAKEKEEAKQEPVKNYIPEVKEEDEVVVKVKKEEVIIEPIKENKIEKVPEIIEEKPVEINRVNATKLSTDKLIFTEEDVLNIMVQATAEDKAKVQNRWLSIKQYLVKPLFSKAARYLQGGLPSVVGPKYLIVTFDSKSNAELLNLEKNHKCIEEFFVELLGDEYKFIALSNDDFKLYRLMFIEKRSKGQLPTPFEFIENYNHLEVEEIKENSNSTFTNSFEVTKEEEADPLTAFGKSLFGDLFNKE